MILHLLPGGIYSKEFIEYTFYGFGEENIFFIYGEIKNLDPKILESGRCFYAFEEKKAWFILYKMMRSSKIIISHSLFLKFEYMFLFLFNRKNCRKLFPIFWGGDLYQFNDSLKEKFSKKKIPFLIREGIRKNIFRNIKAVGCQTEIDYKCFSKSYESRAKKISFLYTMKFFDKKYSAILRKYESLQKNKNQELKILVGNSANRTLNHIQILKSLKKYSNISIYVTLSYGDKELIEEIIEFGNKNFPNNFFPQLDFLDDEEFIDYLSKIDIVVIDSNRQIALGNLFIALLLKKIVCLKENSPLFMFFKYELGINVLKTSVFEKAIIQEVIDEIDVEANQTIIRKVLSQERFDKTWCDIIKFYEVNF